MLRTTLSIALLLAALAPAEALAQAVSAASDPLTPLVNEALRANLSLSGERLASRRAGAELDAAFARFLPAVSAETRASKLDRVPDLGELVNPAYAALNQLTGTQAFPTDLSLTLPSRYESHLRVTQPLFNGVLCANVELAMARRDAQRFGLGAAARSLAASVQVAYFQVASARRLEAVYAATLELVRENERVAGKLLDAGKATPEAVLRARADRAEVEQQLADAGEQASAATREFNRMLGRALDAPVEVVPDSAFDVPLPLGADEAVASALARREELRQGDAAVRAAGAAKRMATSSLLPSVAGAFDLGWQGRTFSLSKDERSWSASLVASWDLFRVSDLAQRSAASYEHSRARIARQDAGQRVVAEVRNAHEAARVAHEAIGTAEARAEAARRAFTLVRRRYEEGSASPVELVDARTSFTNSESNQLLTLYRYAIRRVELERAAALRDLDITKGDVR